MVRTPHVDTLAILLIMLLVTEMWKSPIVRRRWSRYGGAHAFGDDASSGFRSLPIPLISMDSKSFTQLPFQRLRSRRMHSLS